MRLAPDSRKANAEIKFQIGIRRIIHIRVFSFSADPCENSNLKQTTAAAACCYASFQFSGHFKVA